MVNQSKSQDPRFSKIWRESGAMGDINGPVRGTAYAFFDCKAPVGQIVGEIPTIRESVKTPRRLELYLAESALPVIGQNSDQVDSELLEIALDAKNAGMKYVLAARSTPSMTNCQTADELSAIINQAYQSPLYGKGEQFRGEVVVYKEKGKYLFRE
jgi:hypothetical protein